LIIKLEDNIRLPTGTLVDVNRLPQIDIVHLRNAVDHIDYRLDQLEKIKVIEFTENDVYEVNKRIERLQREIALLESSSNLSVINVNVVLVLVLIVINNLFLGLVWWTYG